MTTTPTTPQQSPSPREELQVALTAARLAAPIVTAQDSTEYAILPKDFVLTRIDRADRLSPWPVQKVEVDNRASLSAYANRFSTAQSILIADYDRMRITAHLDWHGDNGHALETGADAHRVTLVLRESEEFARWNKIAGKMLAQEEFARFMEENACDIAHPDPTTMIEISRDLEATVGQTYKSAVRLDNGDRQVRFETESKVTNSVIIPDKFILSIPIYNGEEPTDLTAKFRWRANGGGGLQMGFEWHRVEYHRRAHFDLIAATAAEETALPVFAGRLT